jgi:L-alanine-DL-glutamate epimerase-like enolase superfamily enzyme
MRALRSAMPLGIDRVAAGDAMRIAFDALHGYSVAALAIAVIAALIAYSVMFSRLR